MVQHPTSEIYPFGGFLSGFLEELLVASRLYHTRSLVPRSKVLLGFALVRSREFGLTKECFRHAVLAIPGLVFDFFSWRRSGIQGHIFIVDNSSRSDRQAGIISSGNRSGLLSTGIPITGILTTGIPITGIPSTGILTTGILSSKLLSSRGFSGGFAPSCLGSR